MADERPPAYDALLAENRALKARVAELERQTGERPAPEPIAEKRFLKSYGIRTLDPNSPDPFKRPAYSRRTT